MDQTNILTSDGRISTPEIESMHKEKHIPSRTKVELEAAYALLSCAHISNEIEDVKDIVRTAQKYLKGVLDGFAPK